MKSENVKRKKRVNGQNTSNDIKYNQPWMKNKRYEEMRNELKYVIDHHEIICFSEWASPTFEERSMRNDVIERLKKIILSLHPNAKVSS